MRMIETDDVQVFVARVFLATHQLFGPNQKAVALRFLFSSVRDRISLKNVFVSVFKSTEHQTAAFKRIIALTMCAHFEKLLLSQTNHSDPSGILCPERAEERITFKK